MKRIRSLGATILWIFYFGGVGCIDNNETLNLKDKAPVIDFRAVSDFSQETEGFNQILLRIQLINSKTDILKFGITTPEEHQERLNYYRAHFKSDLFLISQKDTVPCYDLHAERLYMDLPFMNFVVTFNHSIQQGDELLIHDIVYTDKTAIVTIEQNEQNQ